MSISIPPTNVTEEVPAEKRTEDILQFAGGWGDMPDREFEDFLTEIATRRRDAFSRRRNEDWTVAFPDDLHDHSH